MRNLLKALAACAAGAFLVFGGRSVAAHDRITTKVSWDGEIAPLFRARCAGCHRSDGPTASIPLSTYSDARPWAAAIKEEVMTRRMPKWAAARGYGDFANDPSLSPFEIALVVAWVDGGAPEKLSKRQAGRSAAATPDVPAAYRPPAGVPRMFACGDQPLTGRLLGIRPQLEKGGEAGISVRLPSGRSEIVAWIRRFDPDYPDTFWLRRPIDLPPGSHLRVDTRSRCTIDVIVGAVARAQ